MLNSSIVSGEIDSSLLNQIFNDFHINGPIHSNHLETLAYLKKFSNENFSIYEPKLMFLMGLFYKASDPKSFIEQVYKDYSDSIFKQTRRYFTPVQADAYNSIFKYDNFSFSAPTSAGKSFLYQELLKDIDGDVIIIVPSRALLSEYLIKVQSITPKDILVLPFIDFVNTNKTNKRIFIITPERGDDLFKYKSLINLKLVLFDEAQLSEEGIRGMKFDALVRRIDKNFKHVKKVFTHPFVVNPEAQLQKHNLNINSASESYNQKAVGKIFLEHRSNTFKYFSPYEDSSNGSVTYDGDIVFNSLQNGKTILIYISKTKIYNNTFLESYSKYIELCEELKNPIALSYIEELQKYLGEDEEKKSLMLLLMRKGIVIHHGSIPLKARTIIEKFVNENHAKICFSTSTLIQGINMPFDLVWINNFRFTGSEDQKKLSLKNLIGRAGRSSQSLNNYDFGYVVIHSQNKNLFINRLQSDSHLNTESILDSSDENVNEDYADIVSAIKNDTFDNDLNLTQEQVQRLSSNDINDEIEYILEVFLDDSGKPITGKAYYTLSTESRRNIRLCFEKIFTTHLRRKTLTPGEKSILDTSIPILLWLIQGKSFSEIVSLRYSFLSERDFRRSLARQLKNKEISSTNYRNKLKEKQIRFSCIAETLPNKDFKVAIPLFGYKSVTEIDFDILIYDTYDYIDKVLSLSLKDPLSAAFEIYYQKTGNSKSLALANYIRYGTNNANEIWLLRYGFTFDEIEWILPHIVQIDQTEIIFDKAMVQQLDEKQLKIIERYL